jgi:hypothetical protein
VEPLGRAAEVKLLAENREIPKFAELDRRRNGREPCDLPRVIFPGLVPVVFPAHHSPRSLCHSSIRNAYGLRNGARAARNRGGACADRGALTAAGSRLYSEVDVTGADSVSLPHFG